MKEKTAELPLTEREMEQIVLRFGIPEAGYDLIGFFFSPGDIRFILNFPESGEIKAGDVDEKVLADLFSRGIISKKDDGMKIYRLNDFYGMLDVFAVSCTEKYHTLPHEKRKALDEWYFSAYVQGLDQDLKRRPTADRVVTLGEMLDFIDREERPLYLNYCDCKCLNGECGLPRHTCINFAPGINSFAARGLSRQITKEEAKEVIRNADRAGLVHTISDHGICNCCDDCCYLFRAQRIRKSTGFWPASAHLILLDAEKCIGCGRCMKRCRFSVFSRQDEEKRQDEGKRQDKGKRPDERKRSKVQADRNRCIGCGLCTSTCPSGALKLAERSAAYIQTG